MTIGPLSFNSTFFLAPLAGYTDAPFRQVAHEWGAAAAVSEMVSAEGLARDSANTEALLKRYAEDEALIVQLFAPDVDPVMRCLDKLMKHEPVMIDLNCGCPVPKVVKTGAGSALMKTPEKMHEIVSFLVKESGLPISVKFRLGWDASSINFISFAACAADAGASMLTLHARTRSQGYSGNADWSQIKVLADMMKGSCVRVFASGDVFTADDAIAVMRQTGCDGVMIARGAMGNPFIFKEAGLLTNGARWEPSLQDVKATMSHHLDLMIDSFGERIACREMRKHAVHYVKGRPGAVKAKGLINNAASRQDYEEALSLLA